MAFGRHRVEGEVTGSTNQPPGRHRFGVAFIPLGDRNRDVKVVGVRYEAERDSIDGYEKFLKKVV